MSQRGRGSAPTKAGPQGDPWHAFGYVVSGVGLYGFLGWLADRWLGTSFLVALGILVGATFGIYLTFVRFRQLPSDAPHDPPDQPDQQHTPDQQDT